MNNTSTPSGSAVITAAQVALVQSSFVHVLPIADAAGLLFYERVFTLAPGARSLFGDDIALQASRTMAAIGTAVDGLDDIEQVAPFLVRLGARHVRYGVVPEHFDVIGAALLWTLEQGLGDLFNAEVRDAWAAAFGVIASAMLAGMEQAASSLAATAAFAAP
jgi:hemoglobin-like flavoprotein